MKKKKYEKPSLEVIVLNERPRFLAGSSDDGYGGFNTVPPGFIPLP